MKRIDELPAPTLEIKDLRLVAALLAAGTTTRASRLLHLSQPSVSRALLALEDRLGTALFERGSRGLLPTATGERLGARARDMLDEMCEIERSLLQPLTPQRIRIVCECYTAYHWLPATLKELRRRAPQLDLAVRLRFTKNPFEALLSSELDAALLSSPRPASRELAVRPLFRDELVFLLAVDHPLAHKPHLTPADLETCELLTAPASDGEAAWFLREVFGRRKPKWKVSVVPLVESTIDLARAGMGVALVSEWALGPHLTRGGTVTKRLASGSLLRPWQLAWRRELGAAGELLHQALLASYRGAEHP